VEDEEQGGEAVKICYVAGRFSGADRSVVETNIAVAGSVALEVAKLGAMPLTPHLNAALPAFETIQPYQFWIAGTLELLRRSDAVMLVSNWRDSSGARGEVEEAKRLGLPVFNEITELKEWLDGYASTAFDGFLVPGLDRNFRAGETGRGDL
jgi:hypothetical protein